MRGRIVGLLWHRSSVPPNFSLFPSSKDFARPFAALLCSTASGSLAEASSSSPLDNSSGKQDSSSHAGPKSSNQQQDLLPFRSTSSSSYCHCSSAQSFAIHTKVIFSGTRRFSNVSAKRTDRWCWSCEHETSSGHGLFCPSCNAIQPLDPSVDFFQIFSISLSRGEINEFRPESKNVRDRSFKVDIKKLEQSYKSLQKRLHPDLAGSKSQIEQEYSAEQSAHVIQAYYILLRPLSRARYLLGLHGIKVEEEGTIEDPELLMEIMETRESIDEISDAKSLKDAEAVNNEKIRNCEKELESSFRDEDFKRATSSTQRLAYYIKVGEEIIRKL